MKNKLFIKIVFLGLMLCSLPDIDIFSQKAYVGTTMGFTDYLEKNCGIVYKENGEAADPFVSVSERGANIVRFRVGFPPYSSSYSNGQLIDIESPERVKTGMQRAKDAGLKTLLSISYQSFALEDSRKLNDYVAPLEWQSFASDVDRLADSVYQYTYELLDDYCSSGLIPEIVSIGNESVWRRMEPNLPENQLPAYDPRRSVTLHNAGSRAVRDISAKYNFPIKVCFHMMTPAQTEWWLEEHAPYGLNFDMIGISLYYSWYNNDYGSYSSLGQYVAGIIAKYGVDFLVMETAQLFTIGGNDNHVDIIGVENIPPGYPNPPTSETQRKYLIDVTNEVISNGGSGTIVWGGEWVASDCFVYADAWGAGSSWENKTFWDFNCNLQDGVNWMLPFSGKVPVIFKVNMTGVDVSKGVYIKGDIRNKNGKTWEYIPMKNEGKSMYSHTSYIPADSIGAYYFLNDSSELDREPIPAECAMQSGSYREFNIPVNSTGEVYFSAWSSCDTIPVCTLTTHVIGNGSVSPSTGTYPLNNLVTLTATPWSGWEFAGWGGDLSGTVNPTVVTMDSDKDITAKFTEKPLVVLTFKVDMTGFSVANGVYVTGEFENLQGLPWALNRMIINEGNNIYSFSTWAHIESSGAYYFLNDNDWNAREYVPGPCVEMWNSDRKYVVDQNDTIFGYKWSSCVKIGAPVNSRQTLKMSSLTVFPNPVLNKEIVFHCNQVECFSFTIYDLAGRSVCFSSLKANQGGSTTFRLPENIKNGFYILDILTDNKQISQKILVQ